MVIKGSILTPIAKLVTIKGLVVGLFIRYGLNLGGGRTSLRSPNPSGSTRSNHSVGSPLLQAGLIDEATSLLAAFSTEVQPNIDRELTEVRSNLDRTLANAERW